MEDFVGLCLVLLGLVCVCTGILFLGQKLKIERFICSGRITRTKNSHFFSMDPDSIQFRDPNTFFLSHLVRVRVRLESGVCVFQRCMNLCLYEKKDTSNINVCVINSVCLRYPKMCVFVNVCHQFRNLI